MVNFEQWYDRFEFEITSMFHILQQHYSIKVIQNDCYFDFAYMLYCNSSKHMLPRELAYE